MADKSEASTVLIGGAHDGQPINCTLPPLRTLVMLADDGGKDEGYALRAFRQEHNERLFYLLDGLPEPEAERLIRERWPQGMDAGLA